MSCNYYMYITFIEKIIADEMEQSIWKHSLGSLFRQSVMLPNDFKWSSFRNHMLFITTDVWQFNKRQH
jgi:hypothetical protein